MTKSKISVLFCLLFCLLVVFGIGSLNYQTAFAFAEDPIYTTGIADLSKDSSFNLSDYPYVADDYSMKVIQIAVGERNDLFIYTYQPSQPTKRFVATEINLNFDYAANPRIYSLTMISSEGTICKYKVNVEYSPSENVNYVNITSISRPYDNNVDGAQSAGTTINNKAFSVGQVWCITCSSGHYTYDSEQTDVVEIIDPFVGYIEYNNGFYLTELNHCRSHFVAFSTDHQIDELQEADVYYVSRSARQLISLVNWGKVTYGDPEEHYVHLNGTQTGSNNPNLFGKKYSWNRIQSSTEFADQESLTSDTETTVRSLQWVLRFVETPYNQHNGYNITENTWEEISDVTILRLKFVYAGTTYDLGAVSDKVTGDGIADNTNTNEYASANEIAENVKNAVKSGLSKIIDDLSSSLGIPTWAVTALLIVLAIIAVFIIMTTIFPSILLPVVKTIFQGVIWLITLPFKLIGYLIGKV